MAVKIKRVSVVQFAEAEPQNITRAAQVESLDIGKTCAIAERLEIKDVANAEEVRGVKERLNNSLSKTADRIATKTGRKFKQQAVQAFTSDGEILVVSTVTRTK